MASKPNTIAVHLVLAAALLLSGCGGESDTELVASAKGYLAKKDRKAAVIQLKSALQKNPKQGEARFLLGQTLLESGDAVAASVELRKATELQFDQNRVAPVLARALLAQGEDRKVSTDFAELKLADSTAQADLNTSIALAWLRQGKTEPADKALAAALALAPHYAPAKLVRAQQAAVKGDFTAALAELDDMLATAPADASAWLMKADIQQRGLQDSKAALASFRKAVEINGALGPAHEGIVAILVKDGNLDGARAHVEQLKKSQPASTTTRLLQAQIAYLDKDYAATRDLTQPLLQLAPNNPMLLQLAGAAAFQLHALTQAETLLAQALKYAPGLPLARQQLARTYLQGGQADKALETLRPALDAPAPDPTLLMLAAEAHLQNGDTARSEALFAAAAKARPNDPRARTAVAIGQIDHGNFAGGVAALEAVSAGDSGATADLALIAMQLRRRDIDAALKAIGALERKQPGRPLAAHLRGRTLLLRQDAAGARASFERALAIDATYFPSIASLAALDVAEKKPDAAKKRFDDLLRAQPKNYRAMLALATLMGRGDGDAQKIAALLNDAVKAAPDEPAPRLQLIRHLQQKDPKAALVAAQAAATAMPTQRDIVLALGQAQLATADYQQAVTTFNKLATLQPKAPQPLLGLADAHAGLKDFDAAERSLRRALELSPDLGITQRRLVDLLASDGRYSAALDVARAVQKRQPAEPGGHEIEGDIEAQRRNWDLAIASYRTAQQKRETTDVAVKLHRALTQASKSDDAAKLSASWQKSHPDDAAFRYYLGDMALAAGDWPGAERQYRDVLRLQPANFLALNNISWLLVRQGRPGAVALAEQAAALAPGAPAIADTLAMALAAENQLPRALALQKKNVEQSPDDASMRLNLARLYLQSGDKVQAKTELSRLASLGGKFAGQAEVAALLKGT